MVCALPLTLLSPFLSPTHYSLHCSANAPQQRGVETMFLPKDDPEIDSQYTSGQLKSLKEQERRKAKEEVHKALKHWADFFENSNKYTKVGRVKRELGWETKGPAPTLCASADARRKARSPPAGK
jgi:hypothetical protein